MSYLRRTLFLGTVVLFVLVSPTANLAQDMTDAQRRERCSNNTARLAELSQKATELRKKIPWPEEKIARARTAMISIGRRIKAVESFTIDELKAIYSTWGPYTGIDDIETYIYKYENRTTREDLLEHIAEGLKKLIGIKIDENLALAKNAEATRAALTDVETQIRYHRTNLTAFGCDEIGKDDSSVWFLVAIIPQGQPYAGTYTISINFTEQNGKLTGDGKWSHGARSKFTGELTSGSVTLNRVDSDGYKATFTAAVSGDKWTGGTCDSPPPPDGNGAKCNWTATKVKQ